MIVPCVALFIVLPATHLFISRGERSGITTQRSLHHSDHCGMPLLPSKEPDDEECDATKLIVAMQPGKKYWEDIASAAPLKTLTFAP